MLKLTPVVRITWFHVKQTPVEKTPAPGRSAIDQNETICVYNLYRRFPDQFRAPFNGFSVNTNLQSILVSRQSCLESIKPAKQHKSGFIVSYALLELMGAKRLGLAEHVNGFQQTGLAGSVFTADQIKPPIEIDCRALQVSEIRQAKLTDCHTRPAISYNRIGMTTYRLELSWLSLMIALLLASFSLICTFSELSTLSTSIR